MPEKYDVVVIGAGPAGYVAAIRCAQLGMKTAVVESWLDDDGNPALGGTCLNVGCIPSKALLDSSDHYHRLTHSIKLHGIHIKDASIDIAAMQNRKKKVVKKLTGGVATLFKANGIEWLQGKGQLLKDKKVKVTPVTGKGKAKTIHTEHVILATGSKPIEIASAPVDGERIVDSTGALAFTEVPERLAVIGAGVIGLELGSVWKRLGSEVTLLEAQDSFLSMADQHIAREALKQFKAQGLDILTSSRVISTSVSESGVSVFYENGDGEQQLDVDKVLVAVGRCPNTDGLVHKDCEVKLDERGFIDVDEHCRTSVDNIYAIGDVVRGPMLAHKGSEEGIAVAEHIAGQTRAIAHDTIPWVMYTEPEVAWVGRNEQILKSVGIDYRVGTFPFAATGRAVAKDTGAGMVKVIADAKTDQVLGVHIVGHNASELIAEAVLVMEFEGCAEDIARTIHAHPTMSEAVHEAALDVDGRPIHKVSKRRK
ncbi:MAG: dihydrolipoyl dehydrogenase [Gammaproteobacteria bacterium]|nr:MAG: dihydrolipoyl dehydrogenase [Gammaproteobacteria bacterium]